MIVLPDLFGAYQKGREAAIEANWNDLKNYEDVEAMRTRNDRDALQLNADLADYNINRSMMRDNGDVSALNAAIARERFYSDFYDARINALLGRAQYTASTNAANDGRLQKHANGQLTTTLNNGNTSLFNSGVNSIDAEAQYNALNKHRKAYGQFTDDTVGFNIAEGNSIIKRGNNSREDRDKTDAANAKATLYQALSAEAFNGGKVKDLPAIEQAGADAATAAAIAAKTGVVAGQNTLTQTKNLLEEERKAKLAQLQNQRVLVLQNIHRAAQLGDTATVEAMKEQYAAIDADIVSLGGKPQPSLASDAVNSALGGAPTQVPPTPATQTPAAQQPPTQVPQSLFAGQPQPSFTPNGMDPRNAALANLFINRAPVNPNQRVGAGGLTNDDWTRLANNAGVGFTGGYW